MWGGPWLGLKTRMIYQHVWCYWGCRNMFGYHRWCAFVSVDRCVQRNSHPWFLLYLIVQYQRLIYFRWPCSRHNCFWAISDEILCRPWRRCRVEDIGRWQHRAGGRCYEDGGVFLGKTEWHRYVVCSGHGCGWLLRQGFVIIHYRWRFNIEQI